MKGLVKSLLFVTPLAFLASSVTPMHVSSMAKKNWDLSYHCETSSSRAPASEEQTDLAEILKQKELDNSMLQFKILEGQKELETARLEAAELKTQLAAAQAIQSVTPEQEKQIEALKSELKKSQDSLDKRSVELLKMEDQLGELKSKADDLQKLLTENQTISSSRKEELVKKDIVISENQKKIDALKLEIDELKKQRAGSTSQSLSLTDARVQNNVTVINQHLTQLNIDVKMDISDFLKAKEDEIKKLRSGMAKGLANEIKLQNQVISYQRKVSELNQKIKVLEATILSQQAALAEKEEKLKESAVVITANNDREKEDKAKMELAQKELNDMRCQHEDSVAELKTEIEKLISDKKEIAKKLEKIKPTSVDEEDESVDMSQLYAMQSMAMQQMQMMTAQFQAQMQSQFQLMSQQSNDVFNNPSVGTMNNFMMMSMMQKWNQDYMSFGSNQQNSNLIGDISSYRNSTEQFWNYNPFVEQLYQGQQNPYQSMMSPNMNQPQPSMMMRREPSSGGFRF